MSHDTAAAIVRLLQPHQLIGLDAAGHICQACGRVPNFSEHIAQLATPALAA